MKTFPDIIQGSSNWHLFRSRHCMASDISSICGVSPWKSCYQVFLDKIGVGKPIEENEHIKRGREMEPLARMTIEEMLGFEFPPIVVESSEYPYLGSSLDGYCAENNWICELKAGGRAAHDMTKQGFMPDAYIYQCQAQLLCTHAELCFFANYFECDLAIIEVRPDKAIQERIIKDCHKFWHENILGFKAPEMSSKDYLDRADVDFELWTRRWKEIQVQKAILDQQEKELRAEGLALANNQNVKGFGLEISHSPRRGTVDYGHEDVTAALSGLNLEDYRKPTTMVSTIRVKK